MVFSLLQIFYHFLLSVADIFTLRLMGVFKDFQGEAKLPRLISG